MKILRNAALAFVLASGLIGCAQIKNAYDTVRQASVSPNQVYIAANAFDAIEASATQYLRLPPCGKLPCRSPSATNSLVASIRAGRLARNKLESAVNADPSGPVDANLYATLTSSTSTIKAVLAEFGVQ